MGHYRRSAAALVAAQAQHGVEEEVSDAWSLEGAVKYVHEGVVHARDVLFVADDAKPPARVSPPARQTFGAQQAKGAAAQARGAAMAKALCGEAYMLAAREGVQMHGGIGVTDEHSVGFHLKAAQVGNQLYGSPAAMRNLWASLGDY